MSPRDTEALRAAVAAAKAEGREEGAERMMAEIFGWYGRLVPPALQKRFDRIRSELALARRSTLGAFTEQHGQHVGEH